VLKALAKNPLNRYQSAQEMRADALRAVSGRPVMATPVMTDAQTMAMTGAMRQPSAQTTMTRPIPGAMPPPRPPARKSSSWVMAVLAALGVLAVVALGIGLYLSGNNNNDTPAAKTVSMPKITGKSEADAIAALEAAGFDKAKITAGPEIETDDCNNKVQQQNPPPGTTIAVDQPVTYQLCKGPAQVRVPADLKGATQQAAQAALEAKNLKADFEKVDSTQQAGIVLDVEKAGDLVDIGTTIKVKISNGNLTVVPDVVGKDRDVAEGILDSAGFKVNVESADGIGEPGKVASQTPAGKKVVEKDSEVTIFVYDDNQPDPSGSADPGPSGTPPDGGLIN